MSPRGRRALALSPRQAAIRPTPVIEFPLRARSVDPWKGLRPRSARVDGVSLLGEATRRSDAVPEGATPQQRLHIIATQDNLVHPRPTGPRPPQGLVGSVCYTTSCR